MITYNTINHNDFGYCLNEFFHLGSEAEEVTVSTVMILLNVISEENIRKKFIQSKGIKNLRIADERGIVVKMMKHANVPFKTLLLTFLNQAFID